MYNIIDSNDIEYKFMRDKNLVSLKEMYEIFWNDDFYKSFRHLYRIKRPDSFEGYEMPYDYPWETEHSLLLYRHIVAEQLFAKGVKWADDFPPGYFHLGLVLNLIPLWLKPLKWQDSCLHPNMIIEGRIAVEEKTFMRYGTIRDMVRASKNRDILNFADEFPICEEDRPQYGVIKRLHYWTTITWNIEPIIEKVMDGEEYSDEDFNRTKSYDAAYLRGNLTIIAEHRGGKRAAELLRTLQKEWKQIKIWMSDSENMSEKDIKQFDESLYHGFDDLLTEWEGETPSQATEPIKPQKKNSSIGKCKPFDNLLLCSTDEKEKVMARLHELLDGKGGKQVALVLMAAKAKDSLLIDMPTEKQYTTEFSLSGTWRAVSDYIKKHTLITGKYQAEFDHITIL